MYQRDTEILFPMRVAPQLKDLRGKQWHELVEKACQAEDASTDQLAFSLLLIRLSNCLTCHPDSYRAMRGCTVCATQTIRRYRGEDEELLADFEDARREITTYFEDPLAGAPAG